MKSKPYVCPVCREAEDAYYGRLVFPDETEPPTCPNHKDKVVPLEPVGGG